jgi:hypothetical protein
MSCSLEGACAPRDRRRVAPHLRGEGAKMAELHYMEMGWSGSGWMDPLPMENTPAPTPASTPASYDEFAETPRARSTEPSRKARKSSRGGAGKTSSRKGAKKSARRAAKKSTRKAARKSAKKAGRSSARKSARKSARGSSSTRKTARRSSSRKRAKKGGRGPRR